MEEGRYKEKNEVLTKMVAICDGGYEHEIVV
jgi:hypothetical protein